MRPLLPAAAWLLAACAPPERLADIPIEGGSAELRAAIRAELVAFDEATGPGRTRVSGVRVKDLKGRLGRLNRLNRTVQLAERLAPDRTGEVLRHELCHALNLEEHLHRAQPERYARVARSLFSSDFVTGEGCDGDFCQRHELFAGYCQMGPWVAHALAEQCPGDPEDGVALLRQMAEDVWTHAEQPLPTRPQPEWARIQLDAPMEILRAWSTSLPTVIELGWGAGDKLQSNFFDVRTGEVVSPASLSTLGPPEVAPKGLPMDLSTFAADGEAGWPEGPYVTTVEVGLYDLGPVRRHVWYDGQRWWLVGDGCVDERTAPFVADGWVFTLRPEGAEVGWGPVAP